MALSLFDFLKALTETKEDLTKYENFEKDYNPFIINKFLSMNPETCHYANFVNIYPDIPKWQHYLFLLNAIEKRKVYFKYQKKEKEENLTVICRYFDVSTEKAREINSLLTKGQLKQIEKSFGGKK